MTQIREITSYLEQLAPLSLQESYDNSGLQVGDPGSEVTGVLVALDVTEEVLLEADQLGYNLVLSHHPVIFKGLKSLTGRTGPERIVKLAIQKEIAIYSGHTNFDAITGGVNSALADRLGLSDQQILEPQGGQLKKVAVYVPHAQLEQVRQAMFDAGAGVIGAYDSCSFNTEGLGTFRGSSGTNPFAGEPEVFHQEPETRLETIVPASLAAKVVRAMIAAHPYEEVAYDVYPL
jgi:dinuclear metal center YbgI/SA1388 family protein